MRATRRRHRKIFELQNVIALEDRILLSAIGVYRGRQFTQDLNDDQTADASDREFSFGNPGDKPIVGDWNGDGFDEVGVVRGNVWYLDINQNSNWDGAGGGDIFFKFGNVGDIPYVGDWDGNGADNMGVVRNGVF